MFENGIKMTRTKRERERLTMLVIVGIRTDEYSLRSQVEIGSERDCSLGQLNSILKISDSVTGLKVVWIFYQ